MFVGSRTLPKSMKLSNYLIDAAREKAATQAERNEIDFCKNLIIRIDAYKVGKAKEFDLTSDEINRLAL